MKLILILSMVFLLECSSSQKKEGEADGGILGFIMEQAQSEQGQKAIATAKEKLDDKENQEKLKSSLSGKKKN